MKTAKLSFVFFMSLIASLVTFSCSSDDDAMSPTNPVANVDQQTIAEVRTNVQIGTWRITKYMEEDRDETDHFTGFDFTFEANGTLSASDGVDTFVGTWSITDSDFSDDDENDDDLEFRINFNLANDFESLNEDWHFVSRTSTKIELIDISGGDGGTELLTFEKN